MYNIIATGSKGNAAVIGGSILVDCGVPYSKLAGVRQDLKLVLLTHQHGDHFKPRTIKALASDRPTLRFVCCEWMAQLLDGLVERKNIDVLTPNYCYIYSGICTVKPERLTHNVPNCGWHIWMKEKSIFYATDTSTLKGVQAENYDLYMIEANHEKEELIERARAKIERGEYAYEMDAAHNHLSRSDAEDWLYQNIGANGEYVFLHGHKENENA